MTHTPHQTPDVAEFLCELDHGAIVQKLTEDLAEVVAAVEDTGKDGKLILEIVLKKERDMAVVATVVKKKIPEHPLHCSMFYIGVNGELLRDDPRQLPLKNLDAPQMRAVDFPVERPVFAGQPE